MRVKVYADYDLVNHTHFGGENADNNEQIDNPYGITWEKIYSKINNFKTRQGI